MANRKKAQSDVVAGGVGAEAQARIEALESQLAAARKTVDVLVAAAEERQNAATQHVAAFGAAARMEHLVAERTRELAEKTDALERANAELRDLSENLDQIVRRRTRALVASEEELRERNIELRRLNQMKADFMSIAAHELRTPMTSIVGYLELILEERYGELNDGLRERVSSVWRNANRIVRLTDQLLSASRIETGRVSLNRRTCDLVEIVASVVDELRPLASSKSHEFDTHYQGPVALEADADKIHQVVSNLLTNAVRYTPVGGRIEVSVDAPPLENYPGEWARLRVRDNGIGIEETFRERIFEPFADAYSAEHHTSSEPDSAGLGLYVARELVELHGGLITVDSVVSEWTEFTVLLPSAAGAQR